MQAGYEPISNEAREELMVPYFQDDSVTIYWGDCRDILLSGVTAVVTDPPYELGFMGKDWDKQGVSFDPRTWELIALSCLPGAPLLAFGGTRTHHRIWSAIEDGGWEMRDTIFWCFGSGFPKSLDISKSIDKAAGVEREVLGKVAGMGKQNPEWNGTAQGRKENSFKPEYDMTAPATSAAKEWQGYGTALKPAFEPICLAMKPLDGTFAHNALTHGVAGLNIDGSRIGTQAEDLKELNRGNKRPTGDNYSEDTAFKIKCPDRETKTAQGRWPANLLLDEEAARMLDEQSGELKSGGYPPAGGQRSRVATYGKPNTRGDQQFGASEGGASRFFYTAKASRAERDHLIDGIPERCGMMEDDNYPIKTGSGNLRDTRRKNDHPTVKPLDLMVYLVKLVAPPKNALILDPFMGSGTTGLACQKLGVRFIGIDNNERNCSIAAKRMSQSVMRLET